MSILKEMWALLSETPDERRGRHQQGKVVSRPKQSGKAHPNSPLAKHPLTNHPDDQYGFDGLDRDLERYRGKKKQT